MFRKLITYFTLISFVQGHFASLLKACEFMDQPLGKRFQEVVVPKGPDDVFHALELTRSDGIQKIIDALETRPNWPLSDIIRADMNGWIKNFLHKNGLLSVPTWLGEFADIYQRERVRQGFAEALGYHYVCKDMKRALEHLLENPAVQKNYVRGVYQEQATPLSLEMIKALAIGQGFAVQLYYIDQEEGIFRGSTLNGAASQKEVKYLLLHTPSNKISHINRLIPLPITVAHVLQDSVINLPFVLNKLKNDTNLTSLLLNTPRFYYQHVMLEDPVYKSFIENRISRDNGVIDHYLDTEDYKTKCAEKIHYLRICCGYKK